jgi:hypothetical protein
VNKGQLYLQLRHQKGEHRRPCASTCAQAAPVPEPLHKRIAAESLYTPASA